MMQNEHVHPSRRPKTSSLDIAITVFRWIHVVLGIVFVLVAWFLCSFSSQSSAGSASVASVQGDLALWFLYFVLAVLVLQRGLNATTLCLGGSALLILYCFLFFYRYRVLFYAPSEGSDFFTAGTIGAAFPVTWIVLIWAKVRQRTSFESFTENP